MPQTTYATTRAGWFDTKYIAEQKWLQQLRNPSTTAAGVLSEPQTTDVKFHDTKLMTLQKIITALQQ